MVPLAYPKDSVAAPPAVESIVHSTYGPAALSVLTNPVPEKPAWFDSTTPAEITADSASYRVIAPARVTRYSTVPCAGTDALIVPDTVRTCFDHRSFSVYEDPPPRPIADAVVEIVAVDVVSLDSATARSPFASTFE